MSTTLRLIHDYFQNKIFYASLYTYTILFTLLIRTLKYGNFNL